MVLAALAACEEKKAENLRVLELDPADSAFTDFFLICSGTNGRQNQAIAQEVELRMKREFGTYANSVEGYRQAEWILLDYVDFVVHIFGVEQRAAYDIERLRKSANSVALEDLKKSLVEKVTATRKSAAIKATPAPKAVPAKKPTPVAAKKVVKVKVKKVATKKAVKKIVAKKAAKRATPVARPKKFAGKTKIAAKKTTAKKIAASKIVAKKSAKKAPAKAARPASKKK